MRYPKVIGSGAVDPVLSHAGPHLKQAHEQYQRAHDSVYGEPEAAPAKVQGALDVEQRAVKRLSRPGYTDSNLDDRYDEEDQSRLAVLSAQKLVTRIKQKKHKSDDPPHQAQYEPEAV